MWQVLLFACLMFGANAQISDDYYVAAVVEFTPETNYNPNITKYQAQSVMLSNVKQYDTLVSQAKSKGAQIIVFPEYGLYGAAFDSRQGIYPFLEEIPDTSTVVMCNNATFRDTLPVVHALSCISLQHKIVTVVNMGDVVPCAPGVSGCPSDGRFQYNTDVVFSETGTILAKYHKSHLYYEPQFDQPPTPDPKNFTTSFGVTFGIMICFDIMFPYPQLDYSVANITNMIYSTWWVNTPPTLSANQVQLSWSRILNANLLASGIGLNLYSSGSGIYSSGTPMEVFYNPTWNPAQALMVSILPKNPSSSLISQHTVQSDKSSNDEIHKIIASGMQGSVFDSMSTFVASPGAKGTITVSVGNLTCSGSYLVANDTTEELYALSVLNGNYRNLFNAQICVVMQCASGSCNSTSIETSTVFQEFHLEGNFSSSTRVYSSVTTNSMFLAPVASYNAGRTYLNSTAFNIPLLSATMFGVVWE